jgi:alpha-amylase
MASLRIVVVVLATCVSFIQAAEIGSWRSRSIYQIVTDRFARTDNSTTAPCDPAQGVYCGGTFQGIINKLDYIQELGFSSVSPTLFLSHRIYAC